MTAHSVLNVRAVLEWGNSELYKYTKGTGETQNYINIRKERSRLWDRSLTSQRAGRILCPPQIPALTVHWSVIKLGDTGRHCPTLRAIHWAKSSKGQAGQLLDN